MKRVLMLSLAVIATLATAPMFAAFEAHVINVTASISNALAVDPSEIEFGTVFPQEKLEKTFSVNFSDAFIEVAQGLGGNLIANGSFETPEVTDPAKWQIFPDGTAGLGWNVEWVSGPATYLGEDRPQPALQEFHEDVLGPAAEGNQYTELDSDWVGPSGSLNGEPALISIYQNIPTIVGQTYELRYAYAPRPNTSGSQNNMDVKINGATVQSRSGVGGGSIVWTYYPYQFVATSTSTKVEFVGGGTNDSLGIFLDDVSLTRKGGAIQYVLRQKPKCVDDVDPSVHPQVGEDQAGNFLCPEGSTMMPLLCPYLSKTETTTDGGDRENDGEGISAFHGLPGPWTLQTTLDTQRLGLLSYTDEDSNDEWLIDLKVPCFEGQCAQDWADFVHEFNPEANPADYELDPNLEHEIFGCDLWLEITAIGPAPLAN